MSTSHPRPHRAWAQQVIALLVATCLTILAISAGAAAGATQPTATISSATLHRALAARSADRRVLAHNSSGLSICLHTRPGRCGAAAAGRQALAYQAGRRRAEGAQPHSPHRPQSVNASGAAHKPGGAGTIGPAAQVDPRAPAARLRADLLQQLQHIDRYWHSKEPGQRHRPTESLTGSKETHRIHGLPWKPVIRSAFRDIDRISARPELGLRPDI